MMNWLSIQIILRHELFNINLFQMMFNIFCWSLLVSTLAQIQHTPIQPQVVTVKIKPLVKTIPSKHIFQTSYPNFGYQISGNVYETNKQLENQQIHNHSLYNRSTSCKFYNSQLSLQPVDMLRMPQGYIVQTYYILKEEQVIFLVIDNPSFSALGNSTKDNRLLMRYQFDQKAIKYSDFNVSISQLGFTGDVNSPLFINRVQNVLLITDGVKIKALDVKSLEIRLISIKNEAQDYQSAKSDFLLQFQLASINTSTKIIKMAMLWKSKLKIYDFDLSLTECSLAQTLKPPAGKYYKSAVLETDYFALVEKQMVITRLQQDGSYQTTYVDLESQHCWQLNKQQSTVHMICKEGGVHYVAELYYNQNFKQPEQALKLNRYYTQIDDAKMIFRFGQWGNPKLLIAGDYDLMLTAFAINRQVLLQSQNSQSMTRLQSFGLEDVQYISKLSSTRDSFTIGIGQDSIESFKIVEEPSSIECAFQRKDNNVRWNLLVEINSTNCLANGDIQQLQSICQTLMPYTLYVSLFEIDSSKELTANLFIYVILFVIGIFIIGCAFHCKKLIASGTAEIKKKINGLKQKRTQMKQI